MEKDFIQRYQNEIEGLKDALMISEGLRASREKEITRLNNLLKKIQKRLKGQKYSAARICWDITEILRVELN